MFDATETTPHETIPFPKLMVNNQGTVILFIESGKGVILRNTANPNNQGSMVGETTPIGMTGYVDYQGALELKN